MWNIIKDSLAPRVKENIFSGTNSFFELLMAFFYMAFFWLLPKNWKIKEYEQKFSKMTGAKYSVSFGSGRMCLFVILKIMKIGLGDEVIIPAFTCVVVPNAMLYAGVRPVYVDISVNDYNIDVSKIEMAITPNTKAIYAQHTLGKLCDIVAIRKIASKYNLYVIEDAAHGLGIANKSNQKAGTYGDICLFSTDHSKVINTVVGGMLTTSNINFYERALELQKITPQHSKWASWKIAFTFAFEFIFFSPLLYWIGKYIHGVMKRCGLIFLFNDELMLEIPTHYPYPCTISNFQAIIGLSQLKNLNLNLKHRKKISRYLNSFFKAFDLEDINLGSSNYLRYSFLVKDRTTLVSIVSKHIDLGIWFDSVVCGRKKNLEHVFYSVGSCPNAEFVTQHIINFPTHQRITERFIKKYVINKIYKLSPNFVDLLINSSSNEFKFKKESN